MGDHGSPISPIKPDNPPPLLVLVLLCPGELAGAPAAALAGRQDSIETEKPIREIWNPTATPMGGCQVVNI